MQSLDPEILQQAKADQLSFVLALRDAVGGANVLRTLLATSHQQWERMTDTNTDIHLIKGVGVSTIKTDAIYTYISYIIKQYMMSNGVRSTAWTKNTIAADNFTNKAISNIIASRTFDDHADLFKVVATRLMGFDDALVDLANELGSKEKAEILVVYLASRFDLGTNKEEILKMREYEVGYFQALFDSYAFTPAYFDGKIHEAVSHFTDGPGDGEPYIFNPFALLTIEPR